MVTRRVAVAVPRGVRLSWLEQERILGWLLCLPGVLILLVFIVYPFGVGIWLAVSSETVAQAGEFVGLANFQSQWQSQIFQQTFRNTIIYTVVTVFFKAIFGLALAILLNQEIRARNLVRAVLLLPWIVPTALSTIAWKWLFDSTYSIANWVLVRSGLAPLLAATAIGELLAIGPRGINWLGHPTWGMVALILANIWRGVPFFAICLLAGLQTINQELYEAAAVDGASAWQRFRYVTLPLVRPVLLVVVLFSIIWTIADFQLPYVLTGGGPANSTHLFGTLAYQTAINAGRLGEGAAVSLFMFPFLLATVAGLLGYLRRQE